MNDVIPSIHGAVMRGTTPTIIYDLGFDVSEVTSLKMYFMQGNKVKFTKELTDCTAEEGLIYTQLTQEDTYKLSAKKRLEIRCRFKRNDSPVVGTIANYVDVIDSGKPEYPLTPVPTRKPVRIEITVLPDMLRYEDGEDISIDGIEVRAYYEDDTEWGIVPFDELTFSPTTAAEGDIWTSGDGVTAIKAQFMEQTVAAPDGVEGTANLWNHLSIGTVYNSTEGIGEHEGYYYLYIRATSESHPVFLTKHNGIIYAASEDSGVGAVGGYRSNIDFRGVYYWYGDTTAAPELTDTFYNETVWDIPYEPKKNSVIWDGIPESARSPLGVKLNLLHTNQTITVSWDRGDGVILTDDYEIKVGGSDIWTDDDGLNAIRIQYTLIEKTGRYCYKGQLGTCDIFSVVYGTYPATVGSDGAADLFLTRYNDKVYACGISGSLGFNIYGYLDGVMGYEGEYVWIAMSSFIPPIGRFEMGSWHEYLTDIPTSTKDPTTVDPGDLHPL